jgi:putative oxidoreductase
MKFLHLNFIPRSSDFGLLVLRLWYALPMLFLHGWAKVTGFQTMATQFGDPIHIGQTPSLVLSAFAEVVASALIALGLFTRAAALVSAINMGVAFWIVHGHSFTSTPSGEPAYLYLGAAVVLIIAGAGRFSVDAKIGAKA